MSEATLRSSTRIFAPQLVRLLNSLKAGQRIRITHRIRVGSTATWSPIVEGTFRGINHLATGLATDRVPEDDVILVALHFTKDNGELSSITLDEHTRVEALS